jgi:uncharacterized protein GlcG (DUF336 family)
MHADDIGLSDARALIARAVDKAEEIAMRGAIAVVGSTGALVSASRMDRGGAGGMARARSKAWIAATQQIPSAEHLHRMGVVAPPMVSGFVACSPEAAFPGAGGMPLWRDGAVIGGIAASGAGIGPFVAYPGAVKEKLIAGGEPANGEDLLVHYALGIPYQGQHGDDLARWEAAYGPFPPDAGAGSGIDEPPPASRQPEHAWALARADRAIALAREQSALIAVSIVDVRGEPIQQDRMDDAPSAAVELSQALAATAAMFQTDAASVRDTYPAGALAQLAAALPYPILSAPGGIPIREGGRVVGGIGIAGRAPRDQATVACQRIAAAALEAGSEGRPR